VRFNFRGVGASEGRARRRPRRERGLLRGGRAARAFEGPLALAGFSFGAFVTAINAAGTLDRARGRAPVLVGTALRASRCRRCRPKGTTHAGRPRRSRRHRAALGRARLGPPAVTSCHGRPRGEHFFHGQLPLLKNLVVRHLRAPGMFPIPMDAGAAGAPGAVFFCLHVGRGAGARSPRRSPRAATCCSTSARTRSWRRRTSTARSSRPR
jgi:hypothetical protein